MGRSLETLLQNFVTGGLAIFREARYNRVTAHKEDLQYE